MSSSQNDKKSSDAEMVEASSQTPESTPSDNAPACVAGFLSFREKMARRKDEKEPIHVFAEPPSSPAPVPSGSSTTPIVVDDKEKVTESMPPPPTRKEIVLALHAPSATPAVPARSRKRKCTTGNNGEPSHPEGSILASGLRGKFVSLIDGMISECGSKVGRLARDLTEMQGKLYESEAMLKAIADSHSAMVSKLEVQIGELERDLGKTIESGEGSMSRGIEEAKDVLCVEFQTRLAKISDFLGSLECIPSRDLALVTIDGGMAAVQALQGETPSSLDAEEARLSAFKGGLATVDGSFDLILADLKSECFLLMCSEDPEGQDPVVRENGGSAAPSFDEAMGEREWPLVALNPCRSAAFYEWTISLRSDVLGLYDLSGWNRVSLQGQFLVCLGRWEFDLISNKLGGRLYRLDLREEYVFEKMLMRMIVPFFLDQDFVYAMSGGK
ncbi:hypothetical protein F2Q70_00011290 [Brassica cretica]|uniref:Uncharacterized protein n=1 Tax=Brassica cretica TaxID=69181 RepID=A0A8S9LXD9_BRACR|nr:hypothetical protein F2Q70_00011290 [Brassica cretica]KAF3550947.1 hypothetical protein DY000_02006453 [Brassica cretica]